MSGTDLGLVGREREVALLRAAVDAALAGRARSEKLESGARVAAVELAKAVPNITIDGYDLDESSVATARRNATEAGVADRVTFRVADARDDQLAGQYDVVLVFEAIHDMGNPV